MEKHITPASLSLLLLCLLSVPQQSCQQSYARPTVTPHVSVSENAAIGDVINRIGDDAPNGPGKIATVVYRGSNQDFYATKIPHQPVWNVTLNRTLDYETQTRFEVMFEAQGARGQNVESTDARFILHVLDENDNAPQFQHLPYSAEVDEDAPLGTSVNISILATDVDTGAGGQVTYQLVASSKEDAAMFLMDPAHGQITLNGSLDYENGKILYHYRVLARDRGSPALSSSTDLFITVRDIQDSPPLFVNIPYVASLPENSHLMTSVLTVRAVDQDRAIPNPVTYNVTHSTCPGLFEVDAHSGVISVSGPLDTDTAPLKDLSGLCTIQLQATEENWKASSQKGNFTASATANIHVVDLNDNGPRFSQASFSASIPENWPAGSPLQLDIGQQMMVSDKDQGSNSVIQLSLVTENDTFELTTPRVQSNGPVQLRVRNNTRLDYEQVQTLTVKIQARDTVPSQHRPVTATVTVAVTNMNEFSPQLTQSAYTASVPEGSPPGTPVTSVHATDGDAGIYGEIKYSLNNARGLFTIDKQTGQVSVASNHTDREREDRYYLMVVATDGGGLQQTAPLTLHISDVNDHAPLFLRHQYDVILTENSAVFSQDVTVQTTDEDEKGTQNTNVTYSITHTTPAGLQSHFHLDPVSGNLSVLRALDYDSIPFPASSQGTVTLQVQARDNGKPERLSATASVVITLIDLNDYTPVLQNVPHTLSIEEGSPERTFVYNITATDGDGSAPNNLITYSIESGGQDRFRINPDTGALFVSGKLDREQVSSYTLVIVAKDRAAAPRSSSSRIAIQITDVNDELPSFGDKDGRRIRINEGKSGTLYDMSATDPDLQPALTYKIWYDESSAQPSGVDSRIIRQWIRIDQHTGNIIAQKALDRTKVQTFVLRVSVTDTNGSVHTPQRKNATLTVSVVDINNHSPEFSPAGPVPATIRENMGTGTALTFAQPLRVLDLDEGVNSLFEVMVTGESSPYFQVLPTTVQSSADLQVTVRNNSILDYERHPSLSITLLAKETNTSSHLSGQVRIEVRVEDENDHSPHFDHDTYQVAIAEAQPAATTVTSITATDADGSPQFNTVSYSLQGAESIFAINSTTGVVTLLTNATDYDTPPTSYQLTVLASDNEGRRANALLVVTLTDINDLTPQFDRGQYSATLKEEHTDFETPLIVHAVDGDQPATPASNVTYRLVDTRPRHLSSSFRVPDPYSGVLQVVTAVDLESLTSDLITLTLQAEDGGGLTSKVTAKIHVVDVNDHVPTFPPESASSSGMASVPENAPVGTLVYTFNATDADSTSPNNDVTYLISSGANDQFSLDEQGHLTVSRELDRERASHYSLVVLALDRGVPQNTGTTTLAVEVSDVNDVAPEFVQSSVTIEVREDTAGAVYTMNATDADVDHQLQYTIVQNDGDLFRINPSTGALSVHGALDRETIAHTVVVVKVQDSKSQTGPQTATGTVSILILDVDDNAPTFSLETVAVSVDENAAQGVPITMPQITVTDPDQGENAEFTLRVSAEMRSTIEVVPSTATGSTVVVMRVGADKALLDYEHNPTLHFQMWAEGTKNPEQTTYCNVTLDINNLNDNLPRFQQSVYTAHIQESSRRGTSVTTVQATDSDSGSYGDVSYSILGQNTLFSVDNTSGVILTSASAEHYNFEKTPEFYLTAMARDGGGATTTTRVQVVLQDINDERPVFQRPEYSAFLKENAFAFDKGVTVKATDNDQPNTPNSEVFYSLLHPSNFTINATSGQLAIRWPVDYEAVTQGAVTLTVIATDKGSPPLNSSVQVTITVQDENDFAPVFQQSAYVGNVTEGLPNTDVLRVTATDQDGSAPNNEVFYLLAGGGQDKFKVDSSSGQVSTIADIDREAQASYRLTVQAVDKGSPPQTASTTVTVHVLNVNDDPPRFDPAKVSVRVAEEQTPGTVVCQFQASDNDQDALLHYSIVWNRSFGYDENGAAVQASVLQNAFSVEESSGNITINRSLDRERLESAVLLVLVRDENAPPNSKPAQTATGTVNIQVTDIDDHAPSFPSSHYSGSVVENSPEGVPIHLATPISLSDPDSGLNADFHLSLSTDCLRVSPSSARGQATVVLSVQRPSCLDYETRQSMDFLIFASGGQSHFTTNTSVHLNINNTDDETPHFDQPAYSTDVPENLNVSTVVCTVKATDKDSPPYNSIVYSLQGGDGMFSINGRTGEVEVLQAQLDYETRQQYQLRVEARDIGGLRDSVSLTVTLTDLNDNRPQFVRPQYQAFVLEGDTQFQRTLQVQAKDADGTEQNRGVQYSLSTSSQWSSHFLVNASTGLLQLTTPLDSETLGQEDGVIPLVVLATDQGHPPLTGSVTVTVTVQSKIDVDASSHFQNRTCHTGNQTTALAYQRVSFHAHGLRNAHPAQGSALIVDNVVINQGHGYNGSTGIFTAPLNGNYFFTGSTELWTSSHSGQLTLNADDQVIVLVNSKSHGPLEAVSLHGIVHLRAGEQVWLRVSSGVELSGASTSFTGYMISVDPN